MSQLPELTKDQQPRKPYEAPRIISREPLEAMAGICVPSPPGKGNPFACPSGPINS